MPEYLIANTAELSKYARIDEKAIVWVEQSAATGFAAPEAARARFEEVVGIMRKTAKNRSRVAVESGGLKSLPNGFFYKAKVEAPQYGLRESYAKPEEFFTPKWLWSAGRNLSKSFPIASRASRDDLLGVHELFYLCSKDGWLVRPQTKVREGRLEFGKSFSLAVSFSSEESARSEMDKQRVVAWIVKSSGAFTQVIGPQNSVRGECPEVVGAIAAACEARDIQGAIEASAKERLASMRAEPEPEAPRAKSSRL